MAINCVIDDGTKEVVIKNKFDRPICTVYFRPADYSIFDRYKQLAKDIDGIVAPLSDLNLKADGTSENADEWDIIKAVESEIIKRLDDMLDAEGTAAQIFAKRHALASVGGHFFAEVVLDALGDVIVSSMEEENAKAKERMAPFMADLDEVTPDAGAAPDEP